MLAHVTSENDVVQEQHVHVGTICRHQSLEIIVNFYRMNYYEDTQSMLSQNDTK